VSVTRHELPQDVGTAGFGVTAVGRPEPTGDPDPDQLRVLATRLATYIASAVLIGTGYHLWQDVEANLHVIALWSSLACYVLGFGIAWYGSLSGPTPARRENAAVVGLVLAFVIYAVNYTLFRATTYGTDAMLFNAYSAELVTRWANPYVQNMQPAFGLFGVPPNLVTPTAGGGVVSQQSYPALSFLVYVPFALLGINALWLNVVAHVGLLITLICVAPRPLKAFAALILFADAAYAQYTLGSVTDILWALPACLCAYYWRSRPMLAAFYLGLACGVKQSPWFIVPFALVAWGFLAVERRRWLSFFEPLSVLLLTFFLPNALYIAWDPGAWLRGVLTPMAGNLIAFGSGIVQLTTANVYATDLHTLTVLSASVLGLLLIIYAIDRRKFGFVPFIAPGIALFFAARSLQNYFMFWPVALVAYGMSRPADLRLVAPAPDRARIPWAPIAVGTLATILVGFLIVRSTTAAATALHVSILRYGYDDATKNVDAFEIRLSNADQKHARSVRFGVLTQGNGDNFTYWVRRPETIGPNVQRELRITAPGMSSEIAAEDQSVQIVAIDTAAGTQAYSPAVEIGPAAAGLANPRLASWLPGKPSTPVGWNYAPADFNSGAIRRTKDGKRNALAFVVAPPRNDEWHVASISQKLPGTLRRFTIVLRPYRNYIGNAYPRSIFGVELIDALGHHAYYTIDSSLLHTEIFKHDQFTVFEVPGRIGAWNSIDVDPEQLRKSADFMLSEASQVEINVIAAQHRGEPGVVRGDFGGIESD
jgi:uncharacterized membrane protein